MADSRSGGVWWLDDGAGGDGAAESVYHPEPTPAEPVRPEQPTEHRPELIKRSAGPELTGGQERSTGDRDRVADKPARGARDVTSAFPGWDSVIFELPVEEPAAATEPAVPEQRAGEEPGDESGPDAGAASVRALRAGLLSGRRPSPLLLLASLLLLAGALTGVILVMLAGWGAAYLSRRLGDFTRKFAVLGIPLITITASTLWYWGRAKGRWGSPLPQGAPMSHAVWASAPTVLRLAAALTALFLLAITLRRRPADA